MSVSAAFVRGGADAESRYESTGYTSDILSDSLMYAEHARAGSNSTAPVVPSVDDVRLAVQARTEGAQLPKEVSQVD